MVGCSPRPDAAGAAKTAVEPMAEACIDIGVKRCRTTQGGYLNLGDRTLYWQIQSGETPDDLSGAAHVFAVETPTGELRPIASGTEGYFYRTPQIVSLDDVTYVAIAGGMKGTGSYNADAIYRWSPGAARPLIRLDTEAWRTSSAQHLPPGLSINKGVLFDYGEQTITATTSLWRASDGNCCPSGGEARLFFAIEGDRLILKGTERLARPSP